jgi:alkyl hydroperoxide reductase subunit AhpC
MVPLREAKVNAEAASCSDALLDSVQLTAKHSVATPINRKPGKDLTIPTHLRLVSQPKN